MTSLKTIGTDNRSVTKGTRKTFGAYSPVFRAGELYFISGQVGVNPETGRCEEDIESQAVQTIENMKNLLATENLELNDIVKTTIYLTNINDFSKVNEIYKSYFNNVRPARSTVGVAELPRVGGTASIKVEIDAIARKIA